MRFATSALVGGTAAILLAAACIFVDADDSGSHSRRHSSTKTLMASATIEPKSGSTLHGTATFVEKEGGVSVTISVKNAPPGWHAAHVHEKGDCSAEDGTSAGGHFNPTGSAHGSPHAPEHHLGDLGNMWVAEDGEGYHEIFMPGLTIAAGPNSVRGRAIIVHASADDLVTQPTGAAGGRIGCGVIH